MSESGAQLLFCVSDPNASHCLNELKALAESGVKIQVFSELKLEHEIPGVKLHRIEKKASTGGLSSLLRMAGILLGDLFTSNSSPRYALKTWGRLRRLKNAFSVATEMEGALRKESFEGLKAHAYLFDDWVLSLLELKRRGMVSQVSCQAHGRDLYEEREPQTKKLPFRTFSLKRIDLVLCISDHGRSYLSNRYPKWAFKIHRNYLGTESIGEALRLDKHQPFTILSCSKVRNVKRLHRIAQALRHTNRPVRWLHIGSENKAEAHIDLAVGLFEKSLRELDECEAPVQVELRGEMSNQDVHSLYQSEAVDLHVNTSESEGLPVTMMEAISHGVPLLATDVGGVAEIARPAFSKLLRKDFSDMEFVQALLEMIDREDYPNCRKLARTHWEQYFNLHTNAIRLATLLGIQVHSSSQSSESQSP